MSRDATFVQMTVQSILLDEASEVSIILLANAINEEQMFPLVAGLHNGETIVGIIKGKRDVSPRTHELLIDIMHTLQGRVKRVVLDKDRNEDVVSTVHISRHSKEVSFETQASDALVIALTSNAPIYVRKSQLLTLSEILARIQQINDQKFLAWLNAFEG